jgi:hypothetical protein
MYFRRVTEQIDFIREKEINRKITIVDNMIEGHQWGKYEKRDRSEES